MYIIYKVSAADAARAMKRVQDERWWAHQKINWKMLLLPIDDDENGPAVREVNRQLNTPIMKIYHF